MRPPDFDDLVGDVSGEERERLRRAHDLLVAAGAPPELPPSLAEAPGARGEATTRPTPRLFPRRRRAAALVLAAALLLAAFGAGYLIGDARTGPAAFPEDFRLTMRGTAAAPAALASLVVGEKDEAGNWPMAMTVYGLPELPEDERYELLLTRNGRPAVSCGTFLVEEGKTVVYLNAPYRFNRFDGWVVTREGGRTILLRTDEI